jgi:hypothetical protein
MVGLSTTRILVMSNVSPLGLRLFVVLDGVFAFEASRGTDILSSTGPGCDITK